MIRIAIAGGAGRMGGMLTRIISLSDDFELVAATDRQENTAIGRDSGENAGVGPNGVIIGCNVKTLFERSDVIVDFSAPAASVSHAQLASDHRTPIVIGTTGLKKEDEKILQTVSKNIPVVYCSNTSVGVTLLNQVVKDVASKLQDDWDVEILEAHHHHKVDAPSGTALALGRAVAQGRNIENEGVFDMVRKGQTGARNPGDIGFAVLRGGDVVGEHSVIFYGDGERLEISHRATDRKIFAQGALKAARFATSVGPNFYDMDDVLAARI